MMMMMMIGIKTGTMASVIQGTVRPRGTWSRVVPRPPNLRMWRRCDDEGKGYKTVRKNVFVMNIIIINYYFICNDTHTPPKIHTHPHIQKQNL